MGLVTGQGSWYSLTHVKRESDQRNQSQPAKRSSSRMPQGSLFFEKVVPALLILMGIIMFLLIGVALAVLFGLVSYQ
jgi:hypothetical protein